MVATCRFCPQAAYWAAGARAAQLSAAQEQVQVLLLALVPGAVERRSAVVAVDAQARLVPLEAMMAPAMVANR